MKPTLARGMLSAVENLQKFLTSSLPDVRMVASGALDSVPIIRLPTHNLHVPYPFAVDNAASLINIATQSPFGRGSETLIDTKIRSGLEIKGTDLSFAQSWLDGPLTKAVEVCSTPLMRAIAVFSGSLCGLVCAANSA